MKCVHRTAPLSLLAVVALAAAACSDKTVSTAPVTAPDEIQLTGAQVSSLDSTAQVIVRANPGNGELESLADSVLQVLTVGVAAKRRDVSTNLTSAPLYFVGIHRAFSRAAGGSFSTWTIVGIDDPARLTNVVEVSGFAQTAAATAPSSVSGTIGDGTGAVNALLVQVASGGAVTEWHANTGTASFSSDAAGAACPGFVATPKVTCALETMHVRFVAATPTGTGGAAARQASIATTVDVPTMRLTYAP